MTLETKRLILREMTEEDFPALYAILSDPETMAHYPAPFDEARVRRWIAWNRENDAVFGFGLFAVVRRDTGEVIGDCGVTMQRIDGAIRPEIGYHIHRAHWRQGYASEAARACMEMIFTRTPFGRLYSYMKATNAPSYRTAESIGLTFVTEYDDPVNVRTRVYAITKTQWACLRAKERDIPVCEGTQEEIGAWMALVERVRGGFPGLETQEAMEEHKQTVLRFMREGRALCVRREGKPCGVLLYSVRRNMICCLAVAPECRRQGVASALLAQALARLDRTRDITLTTFRGDDPRGAAPRALYARFGFEPGALGEEMGAPLQEFILRAT